MEAAPRADYASNFHCPKTALEGRALSGADDDSHDVPLARDAGPLSRLLEIYSWREREDRLIHSHLVQPRRSRWRDFVRPPLRSARPSPKHDLRFDSVSCDHPGLGFCRAIADHRSSHLLDAGWSAG